MRSSWAHVRIRVRAYTHARTHARTSTHTLKCPRTHGRAQPRTHPGALPSHWPLAGGGGGDLQRAAEGLLGGGEGRVLGPRDGLQQAEDAPRPGPPAHCHGGCGRGRRARGATTRRGPGCRPGTPSWGSACGGGGLRRGSDRDRGGGLVRGVRRGSCRGKVRGAEYD